MMYSYFTPEEAIRSLEKAYKNKDISAILNSRDFKTEAYLLLEQSKYDYHLDDTTLLEETAELLEIGLINSITENGFPDFSNLKSDFFDLSLYKNNIYILFERITYPDNSSLLNKIYVTKYVDSWKVAMIEE